MCVNYAKMLTFRKLSCPLGLFRLKSFYGFVFFGGSMEPTTSLAFYLVIKIWENLYQKSCQTWRTAINTLKKHQNFPSGIHKKSQILFHRFLNEYT